MKFRWNKKYLYWGMTIFSVVCASMLFYFVLFRMHILFAGIRKFISIMMPVICGAVIAYLLTPVVNFLERKIFELGERVKQSEPTRSQRKVVRYVSIFAALILTLLIIYSLLSMVIPSLIESVISIINDSPRYIQNIRHWLESLLKDNPEWKTTVFEYLNQYSPKLENFLNLQVLPQMRQVLQHLTNGVFGTIVFLKNLLIGVIISIYLMAGKEGFTAQAKMYVYAMFNTERANSIIKAFRFIHSTFGGFINGKLVDSVIIGILCYIGTSLLGTPYRLLVSVVVGVTNIIPFFGPYLGAVPTAFIILMVNPMQCVYYLIFIILLQQFDGNILGPKILGDSTGLSSFMVIVAILLFGGIMGIPGMLIGVPLWAVIIAGLKHMRNHALSKKALPTDERTYEKLDFVEPETQTPVAFEKKRDSAEEKAKEKETEEEDI